MPADATRLRRDFGSLLNLVRAHAILHRANREQDEDGHLVATVEGDYAPVRVLVGDVIAESVEASVTAAMRETVEAVQALLDEGEAARKREGAGRPARRRPLGGLRPNPTRLFAGYLANEADEERARLEARDRGSAPRRRGLSAFAGRVVRVMSGRAPGQRNPDPCGFPRICPVVRLVRLTP